MRFVKMLVLIAFALPLVACAAKVDVPPRVAMPSLDDEVNNELYYDAWLECEEELGRCVDDCF